MYTTTSLINELFNSTNYYFENSQINYYTDTLEDKFLIEFVVPGLNKEYINITTDNYGHCQMLTITCDPPKEVIEKSRYASKWVKRIKIPRDYDVNTVSASMSDGILSVTLCELKGHHQTNTIKID